MKKIAIGFDLGTTSVGWSIIDNTDKNNRIIIDMGVRLFDDPQNNSFSDVETRRTARGRRRRIRRLKLRKDELCKLLIEYKIISNEEKFKEYITNPIYDENTDSYYLPVEIKVKGLKEKLATNELVLILHNYIKHRGTILTIDDDNEKKEDREKKSKLEQLKKTYNENLYPCENQHEWFKQTGRVLGNDENQIIPNHKYQDEIRKILSNSNIDEDFINKFIDLFKRHRHYSEGPGSERQLSKYGRTQFNDKGQLIWKGGNLWDNLIGKCTYYPNEPRNYKKSPITEVFNLLNDLANLKLKDNDGISFFLTCEEKNEILSITDESKLTLDKMLKHLGYKKDQIISGLRKDNKDKFLIEELKSCREIMKWFREELGQETSLLNDRNLYSNIFDAGVNYQNTEDRTKHLKEFFKNSSNETLNKINDDKIAKLAELNFWSTGTSSLSKKAQNEFIEYALKKEGESNSNQTKNQMTFFDEHHQSDKNKFSKYKYFPENLYKDEIMPSTVKRLLIKPLRF